MKHHIIAGALVCITQPALAEEIKIYDLGTLVVTPTRFQITPAETPFNVVVITETDIARSPARTIPELLAAHAGIHIRNTSGTPDYSIDLRGFGMTGNQNTLILLDGQRLNDLDLSAVKWSAIPLSAIERIEILRGSGATLYGDNATGGTIHIITKAPQKGLSAKAELGAGSYGSWNAEATLNAGGSGKGLRLTANQYHSDGYRANNQNDQGNLSGDMRLNAGNGEVFAKFGATLQEQGLPGTRRVQPPSINQLETDRRGTATPNDYATFRGWNASLGTTQKFGDTEFRVEFGARAKDQSIYNPNYPSSAFDRYVESTLDQLSLTPRIKLPFTLGGMQHSLTAGIDWLEWDYRSRSSTSMATIATPSGDVIGRQESRAFYAQDTISLTRNTLLSIGGRLQRVSYRLDNVITPSASRSQTRAPRAYEIGLRHEAGNGLAYFGKIGRSFRLPTVNENYNAFSGSIDMLEPQTSHDRELGVEWKQRHHTGRATLYHMDVNNELHYNAITFTNMNLAPTRRYGLELEGTWQANSALSLGTNYTYTVANFREGVYSGTNVAGNELPVVPRHTAAFLASWQLGASTRLNGVINYVGEQRFDNDQTNNFGLKMPAYTTVDVKLVHQLKDWTLSATVNNLLNEKYFSYATRSTSTAGTYTAYPMPERNLWFSAVYQFK